MTHLPGEVIRAADINALEEAVAGIPGAVAAALADAESVVAAAVAAVDEALADAAAADQLVMTNDLSAFGIFLPEKYGDCPGDDTDVSAHVISARDAALAIGGQLRFGPKRYRCNSAVFTMLGTGTTPPISKGLTIVGSGRWASGAGSGVAHPITSAGGTVLDLRYTGGGINAAKIDNRGFGQLTIRDLTITDLGTSSNPFIFDSNGTMTVEHIAIVGNPTKAGATCDQDGIILGGLNNPSAPDYDVTGDGPFQGYGSNVSDVWYDRIRVGLRLGNYANSVVVDALTAWQNCGNTTGAFVECEADTQNIYGLGLSNVLCEAGGYMYVVRLKKVQSSQLTSVTAYDPGAPGGTHVATVALDTCAAISIDAGYSDYANYPYVISLTGTPWQDQATLLHPITTGGGASFSGMVTGWNGVTARAAGGGSGRQLTFAAQSDSTTPSIGFCGISNFGRTWGFPGADGTDMLWDTGIGGNYADIRAFGVRFYSHTGALRAVIGDGIDGIKFGPSKDAKLEWLDTKCISSDSGLALRKTTTALRPTGYNSVYEGLQMWDTTLKRPIWWNGTGWVDATGAAV